MTMYGPQTTYAQQLHEMKYRTFGETFEDSQNRVANTMADSDTHYKSIREILLSQRFLTAGRIQAAAGSSRAITLFNCYVSGIINDSFVSGPGSIMDMAKEAATTMRMGGGIGYDFSPIRPRGMLINKLQSQASGPVSFMDIFNAICKCIASAGHRRGAQMGVLRIDHPDVEEFINAKHDNSSLTAFNMSLAITDEFMECVKEDAMFHLKWDGITHKSIRAQDLWNQIMRSTYDYAEPGVLFIDRINEMNNLYYCENITATNPCAEQPLPPYGACLLGSINLTKYLYPDRSFNYSQLVDDIPHIVRGMDNLIDKALYPLEAQRYEALAKRRMGIGVTGLANTLEAMGHPYGSLSFVQEQKCILKCLADHAYQASAYLAKEKGPFPLYDPIRYGAQGFVTTLPLSTQELISKYAIRNSHLTSIAPTGTISLTADNISSGIEPVFSHEYTRALITETGMREDIVYDYGVKFLGIKGKTTNDVTICQHLDVLIAAQQNVDSSISKTCNVPTDVSWENFQQIYFTAWENGCKGCTTYRKGGAREGILNEISSSSYSSSSLLDACEYDPVTGMRTCDE